MVVRIATFNIRHGEGLDGRIDLEAQAELIRSLKADAVFLQEVDSGTCRSGSVNQARTLAELAGFPYYSFGHCRDCDGGGYGNAILSRFKPTEVVNTPIPMLDPERPRRWRDGSLVYLEQRGILRMTVEVEGESVHLLSTHFGFLAEERPASARLLIELVKQLDGPVVVGGDLNVHDEGAEEVRILQEALIDSAVSLSPLPARTFPADDPRLRLDYIFLRGNCTAAATTVVPTLSSDHRPLVVDLLVLHDAALPGEAVPAAQVSTPVAEGAVEARV